VDGEPQPCWVNGALVERESAALPATDSAFAQGRGCYTTARVRAGRLRFGDRHARRIVRDARRLAIGSVDPGRVIAALEETAEAAFGPGGDGIVRVQASRDGSGRVHLVAVPRHPGAEPAAWTACRAPFPHEGPTPWSGAKVTNHLLFALAADHARAHGVEETLLLDSERYLVEGSRSNLIVVGEDGRLATPDLARGGVAGVGLEVLGERDPSIRVRHIRDGELSAVSELIAVNAIRGPRPIVRLDGGTVGDGEPGEQARRLARLFDAD
jgi:4-amino-4-deoxychorismate lyase